MLKHITEQREAKKHEDKPRGQVIEFRKSKVLRDLAGVGTKKKLSNVGAQDSKSPSRVDKFSFRKVKHDIETDYWKGKKLRETDRYPESVPKISFNAHKLHIDSMFKPESESENNKEMLHWSQLPGIGSVHSKMLNCMLSLLGTKSHETEEHCRRIQDMAMAVGRAIRLSDEKLGELSLLASLHDIGKATISDDILLKPDKLTEREWVLMKEHADRGYKAISATEEFAHIAVLIQQHHEHWDGSGYNGTKGKDIPLLSRIIAIVDAYDAMTQERPYNTPRSIEGALKELERCAGTQFDPELVDVFISTVKAAEGASEHKNLLRKTG